MTLEEMAQASLRSDRKAEALEFRNRAFTWGEMADIAETVARLIEASGAAEGMPIGLIGRNRPSALAALVALIAAGRPIKMIYPFQSPSSLAENVSRLDPAVAIAAAEDFTDQVVERLGEQGIAAIALTEDGTAAVPGLERVRSQRDRLPLPKQIEILTSGTTGAPKQFPLSYAYIAEHVVGLRLKDPNDSIRLSVPSLLFFPIGNISGIKGTLPTLLGGKPIILAERFKLEEWLAYVKRFKPAEVSAPPAAIQMILDAGIAPAELASVEVMRTGAAPVTRSAHRAFEEKYGIPILLAYGATEFGGQVASMSPELHRQWGEQKFGSVGKAVPGIDLRVVDPEDGAVLPPGTEGLLEVHAPRINPDWIRTSDLVTIDADGFLFHHGRADGAIMRGGFKILPTTIERALLLHPAVTEAIALGLPDPRLGQVPAVVYQLSHDHLAPTPAELELHLREHVLSTHIPTMWKQVKAMPRTASMKVDRPAVARLFDEAAAFAE